MTQKPNALAILVIIQVLLTFSTSAVAKNVLFINPGFADKGFWNSVSSTMKAAADRFGYSLSIVSADRKWPVMVSKGVEAIRTANVDYLIIVNEHQKAPVLLQEANNRGIPTLLLLNDLTAEQKSKYGRAREKWNNWIGSITPDNEIAGYEIAKTIFASSVNRGKEKIELLALAGDFKTPASLQRLQGLERALAEHEGTVREMRRLTVNWSEQEAYERTNRLVKVEKPTAIWAANDPIAFGAMRAMRENGLRPGRDFSIAGLNWSAPAVDAVIAGEMELTHGGHFLAGAWSIILIADYDSGVDFAGKHGTEVHFPMSAITKDNASRYKDTFGEKNWSRIDFSKFSRQNGNNPEGYEFTLERLLDSVQ